MAGSRQIRTWLVATTAAAVVGVVYSAVGDTGLHAGAINGAVIGGSIMGLELFVIQAASGAGLRRLPLPVFIVVTTLVWGLIITASLHLVSAVLFGEAYADPEANFWQDLGFSLAAAFVFNSTLRLRTLVGPRVFTNFLLGRYHRPLREARIFLFLDLADSTTLAEQLGDERVHSLIARFFFDISDAFVRHGGETHRYIGDEVVVTWPLGDRTDNARCLRALADIASLMAQREAVYRRRFGVVPRYRAALHCGDVVAGEVGDDKREVVYFGDTVNTAARLASACKELGEPVLVSDALVSRLECPEGIALRSLGPISLRGKHETIAISAMDSERPAVPASA